MNQKAEVPRPRLAWSGQAYREYEGVKMRNNLKYQSENRRDHFWMQIRKCHGHDYVFVRLTASWAHASETRPSCFRVTNIK